MKTIFIALVCIVSLITLGPLTSWSAEVSNPFVFGNTLSAWNPIQPGAGLFSSAAVGAQPSGNSIFENLFTNPFGDTDGLLPPPDGLLPAPVSNFPWTQFVIPPGAQFEQHEWTSQAADITTYFKSVIYNPVPPISAPFD